MLVAASMLMAASTPSLDSAPKTVAGLHFVAVACLMLHEIAPVLASGP